jgi:hypothetical protein
MWPSILWPVRIRRSLSFDLALVMAAELIVIDIFPLDQFALGPTPDSCKKALQAACCEYLWFCLTISPLLVSHFPSHLVYFVSGAGILGMDLTESTCDEGDYQPCR